MRDGHEPVNPDELIYRRVAEKTGYYRSHPTPVLSPKAYNPTNNDVDGISVHRALFLAGPEAAAAFGVLDKSYYIVEIRAGDIQNEGIFIRPDPTSTDPSHAVIPEINTAQRDTVKAKQKMERIRNLPFKVYGPFPGAIPKASGG